LPFCYIRTLIRKRRADLRDDLVSGLIRAEEAGQQLNEDELVAMIFFCSLRVTKRRST
jgi:cytochrome P450